MEAVPLQTVTGQARTGAKMDNRENLKGFMILLIITQVVGLIAVILMAVWTVSYKGGFAWRSNPGLEFNWHPLLMTVGMVFLFANSILIYRSLRNLRKKQLKLIHAGIHFSVLILIIIAQIAVFDSHNFAKPNPIPNLYSLHSWVGLTAIIIFVLQWIIGFLAFLYPGFPNSLRATIMPVHVFLGLFAFVCAIAAALMGITEKTIYTLHDYSSLPGEGVLVNLIGICFMIFAALVVYVATETKYKRYPRPEDGVLLTGAAE